MDYINSDAVRTELHHAGRGSNSQTQVLMSLLLWSLFIKFKMSQSLQNNIFVEIKLKDVLGCNDFPYEPNSVLM
jgi:hypothetical protein